ncbi:MAG: hypothetical protein Q4B14_01230 [Clostridia bacterium]|nr:hypothetical protein [Clostridia bacterium]
MKNMIDRIIEIDKEAQKIMDKVQQDKIETANEISRKKEQIRTDLHRKAKQEIEKNKLEEINKTEKEKQSIRESKEQKLNKMQDTYRENCDLWVDNIVKRTIEG